MKASAVYLDDLLIYSAIARQCGENVEVTMPALPQHLSVGERVHMRLQYPNHDIITGYYVIESFTECLRTGEQKALLIAQGN